MSYSSFARESFGEDWGFDLVWEYSHDRAMVRVYERIGRYEDGTFSYWKKGHESLEDLTDNIEKAQPYMDAQIKWDGDYQAEFDYMVFSGLSGAEDHARLVIYVYRRAFELMGRTVHESDEDPT